MRHLAQTFLVCGLAMGLYFQAGYGSAALAQDAGHSATQSFEAGQVAPGAISIELSAVEMAGTACKLSFVVRNGYGADVEQAIFETVLFDAEGQVSRLTLLDFQGLPAGRLRVRQFQFSQACSDISRVLINGAETCVAPKLDDGACSRGLSLISHAKMELLG